MCSLKKYSIGTVDWFGGENKSTGRKNHFGFITNHNYHSVFVHKNEVEDGKLEEGQVVIFELTKDNKDKYSAKNVLKLDPNSQSSIVGLVNLLHNCNELHEIISKPSYRKVITDVLQSDLGLEVASQLKGETRLIPILSTLIKDCKNRYFLFLIIIEGFSFKDIYDTAISAEYIPNDYFIENCKNLIDWWSCIEDVRLKSELLASTATYLSKPNHLYSHLEDLLSDQEQLLIVEKVKSQFGILPFIVKLLAQKSNNSRLLISYISDLTVEIIINNELITKWLPDESIKSVFIKKIKDVDFNASYEILSEEFINCISKLNLIDYALIDVSEKTQKALAQSFSINSPFNENFLNSISRGTQQSILFEIYRQNRTLADYLEHNISSSLLPNTFIEQQLQLHFNALEISKIKTISEVRKSVIRFSLESNSLRLSTIKKLKRAHPTHFSDIINCLNDDDKIISNDLKNQIVDYVSIPDEIPYLLPMLSINDSEFKQKFIVKHLDSITIWLDSLDAEARASYYQNNLDLFDTSALLALIFRGLIDTNSLAKRIKEINLFVFNVLCRNDTGVQPYVRAVYSQCFSKFSDFSSNEVIKPLFELNTLILKKHNIRLKAYNKDMSFVADVESDPDISSDPEYWFLSKLLPLLIPENSYDTISKIILHEIWNALINDNFDINNPSIFKLFPQCQTLKKQYPHIDLSCEAFVWRKEDFSQHDSNENVYLCRSHRCTDPRVKPNLNKNFEEYSIFDWLYLYGIEYLSNGEPSKQDFAIKLAGYLNRIRELHSRLHCRECGTLMIPNMKYARVEVIKIDPSTGHKVKIPINAAYRLTVFRCNCESCKEYEVDYYINHCIGFKCYEIIDSRDLTERCSEGRYICPNPDCKSCCLIHSENKMGIQNTNVGKKHEKLYKSSPNIKRIYR